jgi:hypothetical protein
MDEGTAPGGSLSPWRTLFDGVVPFGKNSVPPPPGFSPPPPAGKGRTCRIARSWNYSQTLPEYTTSVMAAVDRESPRRQFPSGRSYRAENNLRTKCRVASVFSHRECWCVNQTLSASFRVEMYYRTLSRQGGTAKSPMSCAVPIYRS